MGRKIKILFLDHSPFAGGAQLCLARHVEHLNKADFDRHLVISKSAENSLLYKNLDANIHNINFSKLKQPNLQALLNLISSRQEFNKILDRVNPEIVLANTTRALVVSLTTRKNFKLISYVRDYDYPKWLMQLARLQVDKFLMVSGHIQKYYFENDGKSEVVYLGSDIHKLVGKLSKTKVALFKKKLGLTSSDLIIGFAGRLVDWKGADILLEAVKNISQPKVKLLIFGNGTSQPGDIESLIRSKIKTYKLEQRVIMAGFVKDQPLIYSCMDIFVLPSKKDEPFATSMIEAAMAGLPIVATRTGGTAEFIKNGSNGLLVNPDSSRITKALLRLIKDRSLSKKIGKQALHDSQKFTEDNLAEKLGGIYRRIINY